MHILKEMCIYIIFYNYVFTFPTASCFLMYNWIKVWDHLLSAWSTSFSFSGKLDLLVMNCLSFCLSGNVFTSPFLQNVKFLVGIFFFQLWIWHPTMFQPTLFLIRSHLLIILEFPCMWKVIFLSLVSRFFSLFWLSSFLLRCVWMWTSLCLSYLNRIKSISRGRSSQNTVL